MQRIDWRMLGISEEQQGGLSEQGEQRGKEQNTGLERQLRADIAP